MQQVGDTGSGASLPVAVDDPSRWRRPGLAPGRRGHGARLREHWDVLLVIALGGALGSLARWVVSSTVGDSEAGIPWATWIENVSGAFLLGGLMVFVLDVWRPSRYVRPFLGVGLLGGYTTFSTYALDARDLLAGGHQLTAAVYVVGTVVTAIAAVWLGVIAARVTILLATAVRRRRAARRSDAREAAG